MRVAKFGDVRVRFVRGRGRTVADIGPQIACADLIAALTAALPNFPAAELVKAFAPPQGAKEEVPTLPIDFVASALQQLQQTRRRRALAGLREFRTWLGRQRTDKSGEWKKPAPPPDPSDFFALTETHFGDKSVRTATRKGARLFHVRDIITALGLTPATSPGKFLKQCHVGREEFRRDVTYEGMSRSAVERTLWISAETFLHVARKRRETVAREMERVLAGLIEGTRSARRRAR